MLLLVDENIPQGREVFGAYGEVRTFHGRRVTAADVQEADALLVRSITKVNRDLLEGSRVRFVGTATIGVDHVDQEYLREKGIGFSAAPGCNARSVAEYFVAALLELHARHGLLYEGRTLGVVGYGNVGKRVAAIAPALGLKVLLNDPPLADAGHPATFHSLRELAERCDIITFHAPLTRGGPHPTLRLADREFFDALAKPVVLLNMGRGEVFDEAATLAARAAGKVSHLVLDVFPGEPGVSEALLAACDLATPHIAGYSIQGKLNGTTQIHEAFCSHFGLEKKSAVAYPVPPDPVLACEVAPGAQGPREKAPDEAFLHGIVRGVYDIARDDADLRAFAGRPDFAAQFDGLRKRYPVRHEFAGFTVAGVPAEKKSLSGKLTALGFRAETGT